MIVLSFKRCCQGIFRFRSLFNIGEENHIRTLGDYSKPSHEGYRNIIELPEGNNVVPLRSDTICGPHDTQYCMENPEQAFVDYVSLRTDEAGGDSKPFDTLADLGSCVNIIPLYLFKNLKIGLLEETNHVFGLVDGTKSYLIGIVRDVEVYIEKLKLVNYFYVINMKKDPKTSLLVGRGFLATANAVIDCRKAKIAVGEGITRSVFGVKEIDLGGEEAPY
uniref:MAK10-like protein n=1 Tax=Tanacetum cinerariifolium TaxID=118510 RepID=A0A6L2LU10_TANCI|nr:hypothetical protein [Tanacetum cinerariifolium]